MKTTCIVLLFAIFFSLCTDKIVAQEDVILSVKEYDDYVEIWATNNTFQKATITITYPELENMISTPENPVVTIEPNQQGKVAKIAPENKNKEYYYAYEYTYTLGTNNAKPDGTVYSLPYQIGTSHLILQGYNNDFSHYDDYAYSIDFDMPVGTPLTAARAGTVVDVVDSFDGAGTSSYYEDRANYVTIEHADGTIAQYVHIKKNGANVKPGDIVKEHDVIAYSGNVGMSTGPHLHFHVATYIDGEFQTLEVKFKTSENPSQTLIEGETYTSN